METPFEIHYDGLAAAVTEHELQESRVFDIAFSDRREPLVITVAVAPGGKKWWTSVPQGRQKEAGEVGKLVADYIRAKRKKTN
jgi:hypothetical protein